MQGQFRACSECSLAGLGGAIWKDGPAALVPEGHPRIARRFIAGIPTRNDRAPKGVAGIVDGPRRRGCQPSLRDSLLLRVFPAMNRRAILSRPAETSKAAPGRPDGQPHSPAPRKRRLLSEFILHRSSLIPPFTPSSGDRTTTRTAARPARPSRSSARSRRWPSSSPSPRPSRISRTPASPAA